MDKIVWVTKEEILERQKKRDHMSPIFYDVGDIDDILEIKIQSHQVMSRLAYGLTDTRK